jgi:hypothetical protein
VVEYPRQYRWSSYRAHAERKDDAPAQFHDITRCLVRTVEAREQAWCALIKEKLDPKFVQAIRAATAGPCFESAQCSPHTVRREGQVAEASAGRMEDRIGNRRGDWPLRGFARAE